MPENSIEQCKRCGFSGSGKFPAAEKRVIYKKGIKGRKEKKSETWVCSNCGYDMRSVHYGNPPKPA